MTSPTGSPRRWRNAGAAVLRVLAVWAVSTLTMLILAGILPDVRLQSSDGDSATNIGAAAAIGAGAFGLLSALVWPVVVRALLLVPALVLGLLVFFLNGSLLWLALSLVPYGRGSADPGMAVLVAAVMSAASSATSTALAVRDDGAYRRRLTRLADRRRRREGAGEGPSTPGTVFVQLDGLGHDMLREAVTCSDGEPPLMPALAAMYGTTHRLTRWRTDLSSQTGASQLGILHGSNKDVPAFRWYEKETGEVLISNRPSGAAELQRRAVEETGESGLLAQDGASRGNLFTGGAGQVALVVSVAAGRRGRENRSRAGYFAYFSDPANATRTVVSFVAEVVRELLQSSRARLRDQRPRVSRGGLYPLIRAFATVVQRDVVVAAVLGDIFSGRTAVFADLVAYDEVAHHSGPGGSDARQVLRRVDRSLALIAKAAQRAPRPYRIVLLSDHGQSEGETFRAAYGLRLEDLVRAGCGVPVSRRAGRTHSGAEARAAVRAALHRPEDDPQEDERTPSRSAGPLVLASGNLGLVSFPDVPGQMSVEQVGKRYPALLRTLADHPGIGFLLLRSEAHGPVVLGADGCEHRLDTGEIIGGADPLAPFGPGAAETVRRTAGFRHVPDIMINSVVDPESGAIHAFEEQIGSHGGLGGEQNQAFLFSPHELSAPTGGAELVGAEQVHLVLRRWLEESAGHPVPAPRAGEAAQPAGPAGKDHPAPHLA
ncbi:MAG TPA: phage holin family protein [Streptomyces sp.]|nr:phage holin family protein [Streptomyces sp.]